VHHLSPAAMKLLHLLHTSISIFCAVSSTSAQEVVSHLGGFLEKVQSVPTQVVNSQPSPLQLFLQQDQPSFPVVSPISPPVLGSELPSIPAPQPVAGSGPTDRLVGSGPSQSVASSPVIHEWSAIHAAFPKPKGLLTLRSMQVSNPGAEGSKIHFGMNGEFSMGTDSAGNFIVEQAQAAAPVLSLDSQNVLHVGSGRVEAMALNALSSISVRGVQQWQLVYADDFSTAGTGWSREEVSQCGGVFMLGGYCKFSAGEVNKTFSGLPPHKQLRVVAKFHFIDRWIGETGYMKLDIGAHDCEVPVWSEQHKEDDANGLSLCGAGTPDGKFAVPVEVTVPHSKASVSVTFGSTIGDTDSCDESWGISAVEIYVRN